MGRLDTQIVLKEHKDASGSWWGWRVLVAGETYADGEESTRDEALSKAAKARDEYEAKSNAE